ncbi:DUF5107 domain-containing protein [Actinomadura harenae]|uniref:DUF5107 domain-containing protein n=1 Tax=Actinomadura harenae TaxID=2483351 RepID=A0A3M2M3T9_9ACTN|nr:DUF5107 domain-containing protein [Actinomadura harenae]RMI44082.1 DUF5107 domain-containing protein [Actinomadura harenae]
MELRLDTLSVPAALPGTGTLPMLHRPAPVSAPPTEIAEADPEMAVQLGYGKPPTLLPYTRQDGYDRRRAVREIPSVVLENDVLTATFLPGLGGRLWSLVHRPSGRELLHRNPILQPANLALRDAWLAGGVEWNLGTTGHWPLTCEPLHAVRTTAQDGTPVLRMYEYERQRRLTLCVDAWLPAGSPVLFVRVRIRNASDGETPVYWWSNIAVPEAPDVRVLAPADAAYHFGYEGSLRRVGFPELDGVDRSYTTRVQGSADYFFDIPEGRRHWVAALDGEGRGLVQASTARLRGRKLFHWGTGTGGDRWQEWLSGPGSRYLEIQAGLARTQLEHLPMPGRTTWEWTEAYGLLEADAERVHGPWEQARTAAAEALERLVTAERLEEASRTVLSLPEQRLAAGSGWLALEIAAGSEVADAALPSGELGDEQRPWLELLSGGTLPASEPPAAAITGPHWRALLEDHAEDWHALYHLGLVRLADGAPEAARSAWRRSLDLHRTPWTLRALAQLDGDADLLVEARALLPASRDLAVEALTMLLGADRPAEALSLVDDLDEALRALGRVRLLEARAAIGTGDLDRARAILDAGLEVDDLKEGEVSLDALWTAVYPGRPVPHEYDFRMNTA